MAPILFFNAGGFQDPYARAALRLTQAERNALLEALGLDLDTMMPGAPVPNPHPTVTLPLAEDRTGHSMAWSEPGRSWRLVLWPANTPNAWIAWATVTTF